MARKWWTLAVVCIGVFMLLLDLTIVNVALPDIAGSFNSSLSALQWVIDAYALALASLLLTAGTLADRNGRRLLFVIGVVVFTAGSALCGRRDGHGGPGPLPSVPGHRRRHHVRHFARPALRVVQGAGEGHRVRTVRGHDRVGGCHRAGDRRSTGDGTRLALDILRQHPGRGYSCSYSPG